ncbi:MAG: hypothetical protein RIF41_35875, partial [Polyangiaceae bacterium]
MKRLALLAAFAAACHSSPSGHRDERPSSVENPVAESDITVVRFTERAKQRLAIQTAQVTTQTVPAMRQVGGEVVIPPGQVQQLAAPVAGVVRTRAGLVVGKTVRRDETLLSLVPLAPVDRDTRARATREVA